MLYKAHTIEYLEDFGIRTGDTVDLFEHGKVRFSYEDFSPVTHINAFWMEKDLKVKMEAAVTEEEKRVGLQKHRMLGRHCGMYFPYPGGSDVAFHQGTVPFSIDLIFLRENKIAALKCNTKVGSNEKWACRSCDGVIEVTGGYCQSYEISVGDRVCLWPVSKRDVIEVRKEAIIASLASELNLL